jgi:thiamine-phosphate pyrophosphorylase
LRRAVGDGRPAQRGKETHASGATPRSEAELRELTLPPLHAIVDVDVAARHGWAPADLAAAFLDGGARLIQLRAKNWPSGIFLDLCDAVVARAASYDGARIIVNDRVDLARLSGAAGVHVGQEDLSPAVARRLLGEDAVVGISTHSPEQIAAAFTTSATYIAVGPIFGTATKETGYTAVGLALLETAVAASAVDERRRPVVAIGGITLERAAAVWKAGATSVAVITDLLEGGTPAARVASYNRVASTLAGG